MSSYEELAPVAAASPLKTSTEAIVRQPSARSALIAKAIESGARLITPWELKLHNKKTDCWIVVHGKVYDVTKFYGKHPGEGTDGQYIFNYAGQDCTEVFDKYHFTDTANEWLEQSEKGTYPEIKFIGLYSLAAVNSVIPEARAKPPENVQRRVEEALSQFLAPPSYNEDEDEKPALVRRPTAGPSASPPVSLRRSLKESPSTDAISAATNVSSSPRTVAPPAPAAPAAPATVTAKSTTAADLRKELKERGVLTAFSENPELKKQGWCTVNGKHMWVFLLRNRLFWAPKQVPFSLMQAPNFPEPAVVASHELKNINPEIAKLTRNSPNEFQLLDVQKERKVVVKCENVGDVDAWFNHLKSLQPKK